MADGREAHVWSEHALRDHANHKLHEPADDATFRVWLKEIGAKTVLDYGCGSGLWYNMFKGYEYTGIDQNPDMIKVALSRNLSATFKQIDWEKPDLNKKFDVVFTASVLQHNTHTDKEIMLKNIKNLLKDSGYYMCAENTFYPGNFHHVFKGLNYNEDISDGYSFTMSGWKRFMEARGFELVKTSSHDMYLWKLNGE